MVNIYQPIDEHEIIFVFYHKLMFQVVATQEVYAVTKIAAQCWNGIPRTLLLY